MTKTTYYKIPKEDVAYFAGIETLIFGSSEDVYLKRTPDIWDRRTYSFYMYGPRMDMWFFLCNSSRLDYRKELKKRLEFRNCRITRNEFWKFRKKNKMLEELSK